MERADQLQEPHRALAPAELGERPHDPERGREPRPVRAVPLCPRGVATRVAEREEIAEHAIEEEAEPHAFPSPLAPDAVHAVVPIARAHERQAMRAARERTVERAAAM